MASDAFIVGEDWISEHYFNTESAKQSFQGRVAVRRKDWDEREAAGEQTARARLSAARGALTSALSSIDTADSDDADADAVIDVDVDDYRTTVLRPLADALGYSDSRWRAETRGPVSLLAPKDAAEVSGALLFARPVSDVVELLSKKAATLLEPFTPEDETDEFTSVARTLSWLFTLDDAPAFAIVLSGAKALVAERERWAEGRYLAIDVQLVLDRNDAKKRGGEFDRATAVLAAESLLPDVDGTTWWAETLDDSVKHTVGVSKDLRDGVRESIEIIANEVVRRRADQSMDPLPTSEANTLARQSLRYLYRLLFLLFAEASPELQVLPVGAPEYALGYGLDRLRELVLVELGEESRHRTHLYQSLRVLFRLVDAGHDRHAPTSEHDAELAEGLTFQSLNADLFRPASTSLIDETGLGDGALQRVLSLLLLTREERTKKGGDRGFISYADLGINQLGAVYEGLMSYTGFFADNDLFEVAKDGDASKGSWVVPVERSDGISAEHFVMDPTKEDKIPKRYRGGEFVFRLSGRERQTSASYYSPEVLTKFVVGQALEELLDQDDRTTTAEEILNLTVCEPALGSGAFAIEAVRQLADHYLTRREQELGVRIDPDERPRELQKAKAAIALHQVHGVDLNATAVELAEISLWLDTMVDGLKAPWFGLRLRRGNSLVGARRAVYSAKQVTDKAWLKDVPTDVPVSTLVDDMQHGRVGSATSGRVHHFLLPAEGWGAAVDAKEGKELAPEAHAKLRAWRNEMRKKPSKTQLERLTGLTQRVEVLWQFTLRRLEIAERQVRREVTLWNDPRGAQERATTVTRDEIEQFLRDPNGAYQRLRRVMDAWCAMWFWPLTDALTEGATPPSMDDWIDGLTALLGVHAEVKAPKRASEGAQTLGLPTNWRDLGDAEAVELGFAQVEKIEDALDANAWLGAAQRIAEANGFFHWELDFAGVFARGGFDLQVGNPPWYRPTFDGDLQLAEYDPWWQLAANRSGPAGNERRASLYARSEVRSGVVEAATDIRAIQSFIGSHAHYPLSGASNPDLYMSFMEAGWRRGSSHGVQALIHLETHFSGDALAIFRQQTYERLRQHWEFVNELRLFEIQNQKHYGVNVYGRPRDEPDFLHGSGMTHPQIVLGSLRHDGSGQEPGVKDPSTGTWDLRPHAARITRVQRKILERWSLSSWADPSRWRSAPMRYVSTRAVAEVMDAISLAPRVGEISVCGGVMESTAQDRGLLIEEWHQPATADATWLQGSHQHVLDPLFKQPNPTLRSTTDWSVLDKRDEHSKAHRSTRYQLVRDSRSGLLEFFRWPDGADSTSEYRVAWRKMVDNSGQRSIIATLVPPGHWLGWSLSGGKPVDGDLLETLGSLSSLIGDFVARVAQKNNISAATLSSVPRFNLQPLRHVFRSRVLEMVALTHDYAAIWNTERATGIGEAATSDRSNDHQDVAAWSPKSGRTRDLDRYAALVDIDALMALSVGVSPDSVTTLARAQYPVFWTEHGNRTVDATGWFVPNEVLKVWRQKGDSTSQEERTATNASGNTYEYVLPFVTLDREADMRRAYAHFEQLLQERS